MVGQFLQEYLVGLGVKIDKPGFQQADATINSLSATIQQATGAWIANFTKAGAAVTAALAGATTASVGLMKSAADTEMSMQKLASQMMVDTDTAWRMKRSTDALGQSMSDIMLNPELLGQFQQLQRDGAKMNIGGDFHETMKGFRELTFEFARLKQEVSYAMTWVGYYLMKYLSKPLNQAKETLRGFNDNFIKNISVWTEKIARAIYYVINVGLNLLKFLRDIGRAAYSFWDSFPRGVKIATAAIVGFWAVLKMSPIGRIMTLVAGLLVLIDDYYGYMDGKQAQFGKYWDRLNDYIAAAKDKFAELKSFVEPFWERFVSFVEEAKNTVFDFGRKVGSVFDRISQSDALNGFIDAIENLASAIGETAALIGGALYRSIKSWFEAIEKSDALKNFKSLIGKIFELLSSIVNVIANVINFIGNLIAEISKTDEFREFQECLAELVSTLFELFGVIVDLVKIAFNGLFGELGKTDQVYSFRDVLRAVLKVFTLIIKAITGVIGLFKDLFALMRDARIFEDFWKAIGRAIDGAIAKLGKFGRACLKLIQGDFKGAAREFSGGGDINGTGAAAGNGDTNYNKQVIYTKLKEAGYDTNAIAGIMGRLQQEHNFQTSDVPLTYVEGIGEVGGLGIVQWTHERADRLRQWSKDNNIDLEDIGGQAAFMIGEMAERGFSPADLNGMTAAEVADLITRKYEIGVSGYEQTYAAQIKQEIENGELSEIKPASRDDVRNMVTDNGTRGYMTQKHGLDIAGTVNDALREKFTEFSSALRDNGYDITIESASINSLGINVSGDDWQNVIDMAEHFGMSASHDEHGYYLSDPIYDGSQNMSYTTGSYGIDPLLYNGLMSAGRAMPPINMMNSGMVGAPSNRITYNVDVGGVTVNGTNASPQQIGNEVGNQTLKKLEERGAYLLRSRNLVGALV